MPLDTAPFTTDDLRWFFPSEAAQHDLALLPPPERWALTYAETYWWHARYLTVQPVPLAIVGLIVPEGLDEDGDAIYGDTAYAMLLCSTLAPRYALPLVRALKQTLADVVQVYDLDHIYTETRFHFPQGHRLLRCLGFTPDLTFYPEDEAMELYQRYVWTAKE